MMKLYVGMSREAGRRLLLVARRRSALITYEICWVGKGEELEALALAILAQHLGNAERARAVCVSFTRLMRSRLSAEFWTLRPREIDEALTQLA